MKVFFEKGNGMESVVLQAQTAAEHERLARLVNAQLVCAAYPSSQHYQVRVMPDLKSMLNPSSSRYETMGMDDMMTIAVQKGIPVKKNVIKADLKAILETADTDLPAAKELAAQARPAVASRRKAEFSNIPSGQGAVRTSNESQ